MENQNINKTKSNLGISLLAGCGTSLAVFVIPVVFFYALVMWMLPGESGFFIQMILGPGCGVILALLVAITSGIAVYRATQPRPLAFSFLTWAGISLLVSIAVAGLGSLAEKSIPNLVATTTESASAFSILMIIELVIIVVANGLAIIVGWLIYRHQRSILKQE